MGQNPELYNADLKLKYLAYRIKVQNVKPELADNTRRTFIAVAPKEFELDKDVCTMTPEELSSAVAPFYSTRESTNRGRFSHIRKYCEWCIKNGVPGATNVIDQVKVDALDRFKNGHLPTPLSLKKYLDAAIPLSERPTISEVRPRVTFWLAFSGVPKEVANGLTNSDVNLENLMVLDKFPIYPEALRDFRLCMQTWFWYERSDRSPQRQRLDGDLFLRGYRGVVNVDEIYKGAKRLFINEAVEEGRVPYKVSYTKLMTDGLYYQLYQEEISSGELTSRSIEDIAVRTTLRRATAMKGLVKISQQSFAASCRNLRDNIKEEYPVWKDAFGL